MVAWVCDSSYLLFTLVRKTFFHSTSPSVIYGAGRAMWRRMPRTKRKTKNERDVSMG